MNVCPAEVYQNGKTKSFRVQGDIHKGVRNIYSVILFPKGWSCSCVDWQTNIATNSNYQCKHIKKVIEYVRLNNEQKSK